MPVSIFHLMTMSAQTLPFKLSAIPPLWRQRLKLLLVIACFVLPLATAWLLLTDNWRPDGSTQHGELLNPAHPLPDLRFAPIDERPSGQAALRGYWLLVYIGAATECDARCHTGLYGIRQARLALGKEMVRVKTVLLLDEMPDAELRQWLATEHADLQAGVANAEIRNAFLEAFDQDGQVGEWIYLVDPLGNLLMRYPATVDPSGILKDLKRLLKWSRIG